MWRDFIAVIAGVAALPLAVHAQRGVPSIEDYPTVNGVPARGGAMDGPGPIIVDGMLYVNSGY